MRTLNRLWFVAGVLVCSSIAWGAPTGHGPYIGYVFPAGGQQGSVLRINIGGQRLSGVSGAFFDGQGLHASVVGYEGASGPLNSAQQEELRRRINELQAERAKRKSTDVHAQQNKAASEPAKPAADAVKSPAVILPDLPELRNLEQLTPAQLSRLTDRFLNNSKRPKPPIAETVTLDVTIDADSTPGDREVRLLTPSGLSNPMVFQVGQLPELREQYPTDGDIMPTAPVSPSVVLNGRIMPGAVDRFPLRLKKGQQLLVAGDCRHLIPYLADAVPGWFQGLLTLYDEDGREVVSADHCGFDPDPAFLYKVPRDGVYALDIRDALYRGREDFVYRVVVDEDEPGKLPADLCRRGGVALQDAYVGLHPFAKSTQAYLQFLTTALPECEETEPNDSTGIAQPINQPQIIRGCIRRSDDVDVYKFNGRAGDDVVAEVYARRLGSPLDSLIRLTDSKGHVVALNDDHADPESGLITHHADSYLLARLSTTETYFVQVSDAEHHGGDDYKYYLRIGAVQPTFALRVTPSSINVPAARSVAMTVYAFRKDGWKGEIEVALKDAPSGFKLSGARIPAGCDSVRMTLTAPRGRSGRPITLRLEGHARIAGKTVVRPVIPADHMMQAFAYEHLVPSRELVIMVTRGGGPSVELAKNEPVIIPSGGQAKVTFSIRPMPKSPIQMELSDPPAGVTLGAVTSLPDGITCVIKADSKHVGLVGNLIAEAFTVAKANGKGNAGTQASRSSMGILPAIPFEIVKP